MEILVYCVFAAVCICANHVTAEPKRALHHKVNIERVYNSDKAQKYGLSEDHETKDDYLSLDEESIEAQTGESKSLRGNLRRTYPEVLHGKHPLPKRRFGLDYENLYDFEGEERSYGFEKEEYIPESLERSSIDIEVSEDLRKAIGIRGHRESGELLHALTGERDELEAIKYVGALIGTNDRVKIHEFIRRCRGSRSWKFVIDFMLLMEAKTNLSVIVELLRELTDEEDVFKAFNSLRPLIGHADFDGIFEILQKISGERNSHGVADYFRHIGHASGVDGVRVDIAKLTGGKGRSEFPKVLKMFMTEVDMRGAFNVLMSATRTGDIGDAILEFTKIMNVDSFAKAVSLIRNVTKQPQLKYALEELLHAVHRRSFRTTAADIYRICGVDNFEDANRVMSNIFESDNIVSAALKINRVTKRLDPLYFLSALIGVTQTENIVEADAAIKKLTIRQMSLLDILERIRISSRQSNVIEFCRRLIASTGTRNIQQAWEVITNITFTSDIIFFFEMVEKYTEVDVLVFIETILKITSTTNINDASVLLNKVCKQDSFALGLFEIVEEIYAITKMDVIKFFELFITLSDRFYFEEAVSTVQKYTGTTNLIDALADLRRATGQPDIPQAIEYIKQNKPIIPRTTTTERPEVTTRDHPDHSTYDTYYTTRNSFDTTDMSNTDENKSEFTYLDPNSNLTTESFEQPDQRPEFERTEQPFEQPNTLPTVIIERSSQSEVKSEPFYEQPTVIIERESNLDRDSWAMEDLSKDLNTQKSSNQDVNEYNTQADVSEITIDRSEHAANLDASSSLNQDSAAESRQESSTSEKQVYNEVTTDSTQVTSTLEETSIKTTKMSTPAQQEIAIESLVTNESAYRDYSTDRSQLSADFTETILNSDTESSTVSQYGETTVIEADNIQKDNVENSGEKGIVNDNIKSTEKSEFESSTVSDVNSNKTINEDYTSEERNTQIDNNLTDKPGLTYTTEKNAKESEMTSNEQATKEIPINHLETTEKSEVKSTSTEETTTELEIASETSKISTVSEIQKEHINHESSEELEKSLQYVTELFDKSEYDSSTSESRTITTELSNNKDLSETVQVTESTESTTASQSGYIGSTQETSVKDIYDESNQNEFSDIIDEKNVNIDHIANENAELNKSNNTRNESSRTKVINNDVHEETNEESYDKETEDNQEYEGLYVDTSHSYDHTWIYENLLYDDNSSSSSESSDTESTLVETKYYDEMTASITDDSNNEMTSSDDLSSSIHEEITNEDDSSNEEMSASEDIVVKQSSFTEESSNVNATELSSTEKSELMHASNSTESSITGSATDENKYEESTIEDSNLTVESISTKQGELNKSDEVKSLEQTSESVINGDLTSEADTSVAQNTKEDISSETTTISKINSNEKFANSLQSTTETAKNNHDETDTSTIIDDSKATAEEQTSVTGVIPVINEDGSIPESASIEEISSVVIESIENQFSNEDINNNDALFSATEKSDENREETKKGSYEDVIIEEATEESKSNIEDITGYDKTKSTPVEVLINEVQSRDGSTFKVISYSENINVKEISDTTQKDLFKEDMTKDQSFDEVTTEQAVTEEQTLSIKTTALVHQSANAEREKHINQEDTNKVTTNTEDLNVANSASNAEVQPIIEVLSTDTKNVESVRKSKISSEEIDSTTELMNKDMILTDQFSSTIDKSETNYQSHSQSNKEVNIVNYNETNISNGSSDEKGSTISSSYEISDTHKGETVTEADSILEVTDEDFSSTKSPSAFDNESNTIKDIVDAVDIVEQHGVATKEMSLTTEYATEISSSSSSPKEIEESTASSMENKETAPTSTEKTLKATSVSEKSSTISTEVAANNDFITKGTTIYPEDIETNVNESNIKDFSNEKSKQIESSTERFGNRASPESMTNNIEETESFEKSSPSESIYKYNNTKAVYTSSDDVLQESSIENASNIHKASDNSLTKELYLENNNTLTIQDHNASIESETSIFLATELNSTTSAAQSDTKNKKSERSGSSDNSAVTGNNHKSTSNSYEEELKSESNNAIARKESSISSEITKADNSSQSETENSYATETSTVDGSTIKLAKETSRVKYTLINFESTSENAYTAESKSETNLISTEKYSNPEQAKLSDLAFENTTSFTESNYKPEETLKHSIDTTHESKLGETFVSGEATTESNVELTKGERVKYELTDETNRFTITGEFSSKTTDASESIFKESNDKVTNETDVITQKSNTEHNYNTVKHNPLEMHLSKTIETKLPSEIKDGSDIEFVGTSNIERGNNEATLNLQNVAETQEKYTISESTEDSSTNDLDESNPDNTSPMTNDSIFESPTLIQQKTNEFESNSETDITSVDSNIFDTSYTSSEEYMTTDNSAILTSDYSVSTDALKTTISDTTPSIDITTGISQEIVAKENGSTEKSKLSDESSKSDVSNLSSYISSSLEYSIESEYPADMSDYTETSVEAYDLEQEAISTDPPLTTEQAELNNPVDHDLIKDLESHVEKQNKAKEHTDKQAITIDSKLDDFVIDIEINTVDSDVKESDFIEKLYDTSNEVINENGSSPDQLASTLVSENFEKTVEFTSESSEHQIEKKQSTLMSEDISDTSVLETNTENKSLVTAHQFGATQSSKNALSDANTEHDYSEMHIGTQHAVLTTENQYKTVTPEKVRDDQSTQQQSDETGSRFEKQYDFITSTSESSKHNYDEYFISENSDVIQSASTTEGVSASLTSTLESRNADYVISDKPDTAQSTSITKNLYDSVASTSKLSDAAEYVTSEKSDSPRNASSTEIVYDSFASKSNNVDYVTSEKSDLTQSASSGENVHNLMTSTSEANNLEYEKSFTTQTPGTTHSALTTENVYDSVASTSKSNKTDNVTSGKSDTAQSTPIAKNVYDSVASTSEFSNTEYVTSVTSDELQSALSTENVYSSVVSTSESNKKEYAEYVTSEKSYTSQSASITDNYYDSVASMSKSSNPDYITSEKSDVTQNASNTENFYDSVASTSIQSNTSQSVSTTENLNDTNVSDTSKNHEYEESSSSEVSTTSRPSSGNQYKSTTKSHQGVSYGSSTQSSDISQKPSRKSETQIESSSSNTDQTSHTSESERIPEAMVTEKYDANSNIGSTLARKTTPEYTANDTVIEKNLDSETKDKTVESSTTDFKETFTTTSSKISSTQFETEETSDKSTVEIESSTIEASTQSESLERASDYTSTESTIIESTTSETNQNSDKRTVNIESSTLEASTQTEFLEQASNHTSTENTIVESPMSELDQTSDMSTVENNSSTKKASTLSESLEQTSHHTVTESTIIEWLKSETEETSDKSTVEIESSTAEAPMQSESLELASDYTSTEITNLEFSNFETDQTGEEGTEEIKRSMIKVLTKEQTDSSATESTIADSPTFETVNQINDKSARTTDSSSIESTKSDTIDQMPTEISWIDSSASNESQEQISDQITVATEISTLESTESNTSEQTKEQSTTTERSSSESTNSELHKHTGYYSLLATESSTEESSKFDTVDDISTESTYIDISTSSQSQKETADQNTATSFISENATVESLQKSESLEPASAFIVTGSTVVESANKSDTEDSITHIDTDLLESEGMLPPPPPGAYVPNTEVESTTSSGGKLALNQGKKDIMQALETNMNLKVVILPDGPQGNNCFCTCDNSAPPRLVPYSELPKDSDA